MHVRRMRTRACSTGGPMYIFMSARSTNARSMAFEMLEVVNTITFGFDLSWSSCVSNALTAC